MKSLSVVLFAFFVVSFYSCSDDFAETEKVYIDSPGEDDEVEERPGNNG
jgi:hypothetical protein